MVTVITKTIGPTGRDYTTFTLAEAAVESIATAEFGGTNLVTADGAIVFEADAGTYDEQLVANSTLTTDATRNVTYQPASGSEHGGEADAGVILYRNAAGQDGTRLQDDYTTLRGLNLYQGNATAGRSPLFVFATGCVVDQCILTSLGGGSIGVQLHGSSSAASFTLQNSVVDVTYIGVLAYSGYAHSLTALNVTTSASITSRAFAFNDTQAGEFVNCLVLGPQAITTAGTVTLSGSNNFGPSGNSFPAAIQGSPYPITATTSFSTPLGSGDYAVYMGATGALADVTGNDVWQQGVGPGTNSDVPTTDINGVARSGASCNPGAFEADGFVAPTVITKTIGPVGRDYATFTLAEAAVTSIGSGTDLTFENEAIVFEADAADYSGNFQFFTGSALTCDATRNVEWTHAIGAGHGGVFEAGANIVGYCQVSEDFAVVDGLSVSPSSTSATYISNGVVGVTVRNVMSYSPTATAFRLEKGGTAAAPCVVENCVAKSDASRTFDIRSETSGVDSHWRIVSCTAFVPSGYYAFNLGLSSSDNLYVQLTNNLVIGEREYIVFSGPTVTLTGSNNFGSGTNPFPAAVQGSPYPVTASTAYDPGAGDFALYVSSTGQLLDSPHNDVIGGGVGPAANADVPTTDIVGRVRTGGTTNPGAFAVAQATRVIGKTIGPVGRDYATFTLAEAAVESIATAETGSTDLVAGNARIEFLADAGTYTESGTVFILSSLTTDATRQVTYKPASDAEHGGSESAGVIVQPSTGGTPVDVRDNYTALDGLVLKGTSASANGVQTGSGTAEGVLVQNLLIVAGAYPLTLYGGGSALAPICVKNCAARTTGNVPAVRALGLSRALYVDLINCTIRDGQTSVEVNAHTHDATVRLVNVLALNPSANTYVAGVGAGALTVTGSNNFGGATSPFPAAIQGSPYPITATTNTDPGPGHFAIYDADTGALVNVAANTVWQRGVGPSVNSDVPTTGIAGFPRSGATANPGAFAASTALAATTNPVARFFTYKRPSTQVFNHHRRISCVFPDDGPSGNGNTFAVGVAARGFISPISRDCVAFFVYYTTDGAGVQTSLRLEVARLLGPYSQDTIAEAQPIAVIEKQAVGEAIPAGFNFPGQSHTVAFRVQTFSGATTPESAAEYTAFIDGTAVTFDTFYQSSTQDGTTKVVTHPAPAVGTTQGRAESFFWYATADRVDLSGSENYSLPQWSAWTQLAVDPDPLFDGDGQTVGVLGEGTGTVNLSTAVEHVDWNISIQYELPRFDVPFASGHRYTSPRFENARRLITASATNVDKATMDLIVQFHAARKGIEDPFLFNFPVPATMASETYTVITVQFADQNGMVYRREAENTYSVQLNLLELL